MFTPVSRRNTQHSTYPDKTRNLKPKHNFAKTASKILPKVWWLIFLLFRIKKTTNFLWSFHGEFPDVDCGDFMLRPCWSRHNPVLSVQSVIYPKYIRFVGNSICYQLCNLYYVDGKLMCTLCARGFTMKSKCQSVRYDRNRLDKSSSQCYLSLRYHNHFVTAIFKGIFLCVSPYLRFHLI